MSGHALRGLDGPPFVRQEIISVAPKIWQPVAASIPVRPRFLSRRGNAGQQVPRLTVYQVTVTVHLHDGHFQMQNNRHVLPQ
jgi:hypothetical protein